MLSGSDLEGVFGIMPTPAIDGADRMDAVSTVNLDETARLSEQLIRDGVSGLIALGTMGECATLTQQEYESFVECLLSTVKKRVPVFVGTTALGAHDVVRRIRFVKARGADGTLLGLPMWQPCTLDMAVEYYSSLSEMFPEFAFMVYANSRAFRFDFGVEFWRRIANRSNIIASKFSNRSILVDALAASNRRINFIGKETQAYHFAQLSAETTTACWIPAVYPQPAIALMNAIKTRDWNRAKQVADDLAWAGEPVHRYSSDSAVFASYNIQIEKLFMSSSGYAKAGPIRPPYHIVPAEIREAAQEHGRRYLKLRDKYTPH